MQLLSRWLCLIAAGFALQPGLALAQRTSENAVTQSSDAFGRSVGNERTGLYNPEDVRGFNPVDAGNARIEGLYFDQLERPPTRLTNSNTIRVGISAQRYPFPAPTGLVDHIMTKPGSEAAAALTLERGPSGGFAGSVEFGAPVDGGAFGISGGIGWRDQIRPEGGRNQFRNAGLTMVAKPYAGAEVMVFAGGFINRGDEARPTYFVSGNVLPPKIARGVFTGQDWTDRAGDFWLVGGVAKLPVGSYRIELGLFEAGSHFKRSFADLSTGVTETGTTAARTIIADGNNKNTSRSGELRIVREIAVGNLRHSITASWRGRIKDRRFGGAVAIPIANPRNIGLSDPRPEPVFALGAENDDATRQFTAGAFYSLVWAGRGSLDLGLSKSRYTKTVDFASPLLPTITTRDRPWLWSVGASVILTKRLALYGGAAQGQEEAPIAPDIASNRAEAPPAIQTKQIEAGLRYAITDKLTLVAGLFSIKKPFFNLDAASRFRELGQLDNRGIEVSLAGQIVPGWTVIAGTVFTDPKLAGAKTVPVGQTKRRSIINLDWRTEHGTGAWSIDLGVESISARAANLGNTLFASARETVNLGARYRFEVAGTKMLIRPQVTNLLGDYGWQVSSSRGFTYASGRTWTTQLVADF